MEKREFSTNPASKLYQIYKDKFNIVNQTSLTRQMTTVGKGTRACRQKMTHEDIKIHISLYRNVGTYNSKKTQKRAWRGNAKRR